MTTQTPITPLPLPDDLDTPALVVDVDALDRNIAALAEWTHARGVKLRPHAKSHKSAEIARRQIAAGAIGVCVQKSSEALALARAGVPDLLISNEVVPTRAKLDRVVEAAKIARRLGVAVDSPVQVDALAAAALEAGATLDVLVEIDVGQHRCGVATPDEALALARRVAAAGPALNLRGLQAYHGGAQHLRSAAERRAAIDQAARLARATRDAFVGAGLTCDVVGGAGTGTFMFETATGVWTELQAGSYVFMDRDYADNVRDDDAPRFAHALFVAARVVSVHADRVVIDAGHKSHAIDSGLPTVVEPGWTFHNGGDEHGVLRPAPGATPSWPAVGDLMRLIPGHCDPTVNLHDRILAVRDGRAVDDWCVDARGCVA